MIETAEKREVMHVAHIAAFQGFAEPATLAELFQRSADEFDLPNALNYKHEGTWQPISSREVVERARNIASGLYSIGLRKGDRAAILAANSPEWVLCDAGCQFAGVIDVPVYGTLAADAVKYILCDSAARVLFVGSDELYRHIASILPECPALEKVIFIRDRRDNDALSLVQLERIGKQLRNESPGLVAELSAAVCPGDVATIIYTSGTTGEPKGVMLSHTNLVSNVVDASEKYVFAGSDVSLSVLPLSHVFERTGMYAYIRFGVRVYFAESIECIPDNLQEVRPTLFIGVPRIFEKVFERARLKAAQAGRANEIVFDRAIEIAKHYALCREAGQHPSPSLDVQHRIADILVYRKFREFFGGRLRHCITGGAALPDEIFLIFTGAGVSIMQGYGLTETSPVVSSNNPSAMRLGTVGRPIRNVEVRTASDGEIEVRGPGVMLGYYHKPDATREAFTADGWFRTGDIGLIDKDGYLIITDRKKELFKTSGGKYIAPSPIEQMLRGSRFINQAVLVGNERKFPAALIVPNFDMLASYAELKGLDISSPIEFCSHERIIDLFSRQIDAINSRLGQFEKVKKFALLERELSVEEGELTPTLKLKRGEINERYRHLIDELYS